MRPDIRKFVGLDKPRRFIAAALVLLFLHVAFPRYLVATGSTDPTIPKGSYVIGSRLHRLVSEPTTNDIVVIAPHPGISPHPWMHRIVGIEGDPIAPLEVPRPKAAKFDITAGLGETTAPPASVPPGFFYQAGDARSAYHGLVPKDRVQAKVLLHFRLPWLRNKPTSQSSKAQAKD